MSTYSNGYLKFWVRSVQQLKVNLEGPQNYKGTVYIPTTTNNWLEFTLPVSSFANIVITNMYGLFEITGEAPGTFYVDDVRWVTTP